MTLAIRRTQWAVGQGGFASGHITDGKSSFEYIYDCGANGRAALMSSAAALQPKDDIVDAMFLSHLDSDHVNGIDLLVTANDYSVRNLFLP